MPSKNSKKRSSTSVRGAGASKNPKQQRSGVAAVSSAVDAAALERDRRYAERQNKKKAPVQPKKTVEPLSSNVVDSGVVGEKEQQEEVLVESNGTMKKG